MYILQLRHGDTAHKYTQQNTETLSVQFHQQQETVKTVVHTKDRLLRQCHITTRNG